jgi:hypothetical protein
MTRLLVLSIQYPTAPAALSVVNPTTTAKALIDPHPSDVPLWSAAKRWGDMPI